MKHLRLFVCMTAIAMLFTECKKTASFEDLVSIKNADQAQEVTFEDMATNIRIVPLVSDEPIDGLSNMKCYGSTTIYYSVNGFIYVFEDGKQVAKLDKKGRGRGEYTLITDYVYSPSSKVLSIIDAFTTIHKYSVPEMQYLGSVSIDGMAMSMAEHDDSTLLCRMVPKDVEKTAICFVSSNTGRVRKIHKDVSVFSMLLSSNMAYYTPDYRYLTETGSICSVLEIPSDIDQEAKTILHCEFGDLGIPAEFDTITEENSTELTLSLIQFLSEKRESVIASMTWPVVKDDYVSFWYDNILSSLTTYCRVSNDGIVKYSGFTAKGTKKKFTPNTMANTTYVTLVQGLPESVFEETDERSQFSADLEKAMNAQAFNNPILVYYDIK